MEKGVSLLLFQGAVVAQMVEQGAFNPGVAGSSPAGGTFRLFSGICVGTQNAFPKERRFVLCSGESVSRILYRTLYCFFELGVRWRPSLWTENYFSVQASYFSSLNDF